MHAYNLFFHEQMYKGLRTQQVAHAWRNLSETEKAAYADRLASMKGRSVDQAVGNHAELDAPLVFDPKVHTHLGIGSDECALSQEHLEDIAANVDLYHKKWVELVSGVIVEEDTVLKTSVKPCWDLYGVGRCRKDFNDERKREIARMKEVLHHISSLPADKFHDLRRFEMIGIFPPDDLAAGSAANPMEHRQLFLLIKTLHNPVKQVFWRCQSDATIPAAGDRVRKILHWEAFWNEVQVAMHMYDHFRAYKIVRFLYFYESLTQLVVTSVEDVTKHLQSPKVKTKVADDIKGILDLLKLEGKKKESSRW